MVGREIIRPGEEAGPRRRREKSRYFGLFPLEISFKITKIAPAAGKILSCMLVYRRSVDKHTTQNHEILPAAGEKFLVIHRVYSGKASIFARRRRFFFRRVGQKIGK